MKEKKRTPSSASLLLSPPPRGKHIVPSPPKKEKMTHRPDSAASLDAAGFPVSPLQDVTCVVGEVRKSARAQLRKQPRSTIKSSKRVGGRRAAFEARRKMLGGRQSRSRSPPS